MPAHTRVITAGVPLILLAACATHRQMDSFRIVRDAAGPVLIPPGLRDATPNKRATATCNAVKIDRPKLESMDAAALESIGCEPEIILQSVPASLNALRKLTQPEISRTGYADLGTDDSIRVVSPVFKTAATNDAAIKTESVTGSGYHLDVAVKSSPNLIGYEMSWYTISQAGKNQCAISPRSAELHIEGKTETEAVPREPLFHFSPAACRFRQFVLTRRSGSDHDVFILAARNTAQMVNATERLSRDPAAACDQIGPDFCVKVPKLVAVNAFITVAVNGTRTDVEKGATVASLLRGASPNEITVRRRWRGQLRPVLARDVRDVTALPLESGDEISWR